MAKRKVLFGYNYASGSMVGNSDSIQCGQYLGADYYEEGVTPEICWLYEEGSYKNYFIVKDNLTAEFSLYYDGKQIVETGKLQYRGTRSLNGITFDCYSFDSRSFSFWIRYLHQPGSLPYIKAQVEF